LTGTVPNKILLLALSQKYLPPKFWAGWLVTTFIQADGLHLSPAQPCSSVSSLSDSTFLLDVQNSTDKKLAETQDRQALQNSDEKQKCHSYIA